MFTLLYQTHAQSFDFFFKFSQAQLLHNFGLLAFWVQASYHSQNLDSLSYLKGFFPLSKTVPLGSIGFFWGDIFLEADPKDWGL